MSTKGKIVEPLVDEAGKENVKDQQGGVGRRPAFSEASICGLSPVALEDRTSAVKEVVLL